MMWPKIEVRHAFTKPFSIQLVLTSSLYRK